MNVATAKMRVAELSQALARRSAVVSNADPEWRELLGQLKVWQTIVKALEGVGDGGAVADK